MLKNAKRYYYIKELIRKIDLLSVLDDIATTNRARPRVRMKQYLESGDKVLSYIEDYNEQISEWLAVCRAFQAQVAQREQQLTIA